MSVITMTFKMFMTAALGSMYQGRFPKIFLKLFDLKKQNTLHIINVF